MYGSRRTCNESKKQGAEKETKILEKRLIT